MNKRIWLSPPHMGGEELTFVKEAFETNWVSPAGPHIDAFEQELATMNDVGYCAVVSSGTAAIHLALVILNVKPGDEVICSTFTFSGSCNPIKYVGATPVFVESELETWNMDPIWLEAAIADGIKRNKKPKAIIVVHLYGMPSKMDEIMKISRMYEIPVIEDAAEAIGSTYKERPAGSFGDFGIYSFNGNKIITTSGGGALVSKNEKWIKKARFLATQARDAAPYYQHSEIGYNYRLSNICAAIGRGQLKVLDERVKQRRANFESYQEGLKGLPGLSFLTEPSGFFSNRWLTTILLDSPVNQKITPDLIRIALDQENIESRPLWKPMHLQPVFSGAKFFGQGVSETLFRTGLCLPSGSSMTREDVDRVIHNIRLRYHH